MQIKNISTISRKHAVLSVDENGAAQVRVLCVCVHSPCTQTPRFVTDTHTHTHVSLRPFVAPTQLRVHGNAGVVVNAGDHKKGSSLSLKHMDVLAIAGRTFRVEITQPTAQQPAKAKTIGADDETVELPASMPFSLKAETNQPRQSLGVALAVSLACARARV